MEVIIPGAGNLYAEEIWAMFPPSAQTTFFKPTIPLQALSDQLRLRLEDPELPPLFVSGGSVE